MASTIGRRRLAAMLGMLAATALALPAVAGPPVPEPFTASSLPGSTFEIDADANLRVDTAGNLDWANVDEVRKADMASGASDDSFGQGSKENTAVPTVVTGGIPPNKSDLKVFGVYQEGATSAGFLNLFWSRVQDPSGTTNMDFELNQNRTKSANGVTPVRTPGDLLITYDLSRGGTVPVLSLREWTGAVWGPETDLSASNKAVGSINSSTIPAAESDGLGRQDPRTFGEAQVALSALVPPGTCKSLAAAYVKSRASDSFNAELKDFIAPVDVDITVCGKIKIIKTDDAKKALAGAEFTLYKDNAPTGGSRGAEDTVTNLKCTTGANGTCVIENIPPGEYWLVETVVPPNHAGVADQHVTVRAGEHVVVGPLVDQRHRGAILITKTRKHAATGPGDHPHAGVAFTVNGVTKLTDAHGRVCFDGLPFGDYTVHETVPAGYVGEGDKTVTVDNKASCSDAPYAGEKVTFRNTPLTTITITVTPQVPGGTKATSITCTGQSATDQQTATFKDLLPGTYTCTIVIDP